MAGTITARLAELGIELPKLPAPAGAYVPYTISGKILFISGQIPMRNGALSHTGKVGGDLSVEEGYECGRVCALNILAQAAAACGGDLDKVTLCLNLRGFVICGPDFNDHPKLINGGSELMLQVFGDNVKRARFAV